MKKTMMKNSDLVTNFPYSIIFQKKNMRIIKYNRPQTLQSTTINNITWFCE
jgi:hypothetical protein